MNEPEITISLTDVKRILWCMHLLWDKGYIRIDEDIELFKTYNKLDNFKKEYTNESNWTY